MPCLAPQSMFSPGKPVVNTGCDSPRLSGRGGVTDQAWKMGQSFHTRHSSYWPVLERPAMEEERQIPCLDSPCPVHPWGGHSWKRGMKHLWLGSPGTLLSIAGQQSMKGITCLSWQSQGRTCLKRWHNSSARLQMSCLAQQRLTMEEGT